MEDVACRKSAAAVDSFLPFGSASPEDAEELIEILCQDTEANREDKRIL